MNKQLLQQAKYALGIAVRQNTHDMLMTGEECRKCEYAIKALQSAIAQPEQPATDKCRKCSGRMKPGQAIAQTFSRGLPDFPGDTHGMTVSPSGPGKLIDCLKCETCGWSVTGTSAEYKQAALQPLTDEQIEAIGHRRAWKYKHSSDPHHSSTYTFNRHTLIDFGRDIAAHKAEKD